MKLQKMVFASHNPGKVKEIKDMLAPLEIEVVSAAELNLPDVEETGVTFAENAALKAETLAKISGLPCLADDSGLCVAGLDNRPGVYSARYAPARDFNRAMEMILQELKEKDAADRSTCFACVLALKIPGQPCRFFEGRVAGKIAEAQRGSNGFGYDAIFIPEGEDRTFAEMTAGEKAAISHRGRALQNFLREVQAL